MSTFPIAIAIPIKAVPKNKKLMPNSDRKTIPAAKTIKEMKMVLSIPNFSDSFGANGDTIAKANKGNVVISPAVVFVKPRSSRINDISDPTDVSGARKLAPTNKIPRNIIQYVVFRFSPG